MMQKIPSSLVAVSQVPYPGNLKGTELVGKDSIQKLWKAFSTSRQASKDGKDCRLESLFWRILGTEKLVQQINVQGLDQLITRIISNEPLQPVGLLKASPQPIPATQPTSDPIDQVPKTIHPILKKPNTVPVEPYHKSARLLLEKPDGKKITLGPSNSPPPDIVTTQPKESPPSRQAPKRAQTAGPRTTKGFRRRPLFNRRKSSQSSFLKTPTRERRESIENVKKREIPDGHIEAMDQSTSKNNPEDLVILNPADSFDPFFDADDGINDGLGPEITPPHPQPPASLPSGRATSWTESEIDPLAVKLTIPIRAKPKNPLTPTEPTLATASSTTQVPGSPPVHSMSAKTDPVISPGIETVSAGPSQDSKLQTETQDPSTSNPKDTPPTPQPVTPLDHDLAPWPHLRRVPMPQKMLDTLVEIFSNPVPVERIKLPDAPLHLVSNAGPDSTAHPQPSNTPLVQPGFRSRFAREMEKARLEEEEPTPESELRFAAIQKELEGQEEASATASEQDQNAPFAQREPLFLTDDMLSRSDPSHTDSFLEAIMNGVPK
ncbi:hypothetical protein N7470_003152 [Penicillium chermesinum]|nr:hypothetical protein N7470_003152 [Penicillium chermesinum]